MIKVTLKDGVVKEYESGTTVAEVAKSLGAGLYKSMCACKINGNVCDVRTPLTEDCELAILTFDNVDGKRLSGILHLIFLLRLLRDYILRQSLLLALRLTQAFIMISM